MHGMCTRPFLFHSLIKGLGTRLHFRILFTMYASGGKNSYSGATIAGAVLGAAHL